MKPHRPTDPRERLAQIERKIASLQRKVTGGLTCCGEIGGVRSRSTKRKNQIADSRVNASVQLCKLYPIRNLLRQTVARLDRGEPEPVAPISLLSRVRGARPKRAPRTEPRRMRSLPPKVTAIFIDQDAANAYMETHSEEGLLAELDGRFYLARLDDLGERVTEQEFTARITPQGEAIIQAAAGGCF